MNAKHTPTWRSDDPPATDATGCPVFWVNVDSPRIGSMMIRCEASVDDAELAFRARLVAAAPELLAVVERIARYCEQDSHPELQGIACDAFAAIAKATGA